MLGTGDCFEYRHGNMRITALCDVSFVMDKDFVLRTAKRTVRPRPAKSP